MITPRLFQIKRKVAEDAYDEPSGFADLAFLDRLAADISNGSLAPVGVQPPPAGTDSEEVTTMTDAKQKSLSFVPGDILGDELDARGWTATNFAKRISERVEIVAMILDGTEPITLELARKIGRELGNRTEIWVRLETAYRRGPIRRR